MTHTQQPSFLKIAGEHSGSAADRYAESVKLPRYEKKCKAHGLKFVPMVVSCFGAWCSQANPVFSFISKAAAHRRSWHPDLATIFLRQRLSVALQRQNALTLAKHYCVSDLEGWGPVPFTCGSGRQICRRCCLVGPPKSHGSPTPYQETPPRFLPTHKSRIIRFEDQH